MKYRPYFPGSQPVSAIGLGAWQLGINSGWKGLSEEDALRLVHTSLDHGVNFFDTAPNYGHGTGEERLGKGLRRADRTKIVVNTKFGHTHTGTLDFSAKSIRASLEGSLRRLQMDYVDSLLIHNPPRELFDGRVHDQYEVLERLKEEGKIRAYGASLDTYEDMKLLLETTGAEVMEIFFNVLHQDTARGFALAKERAAGLIVKVPLDSGWLSGKYDADSTFDDIRARWSRADIAQRAALVARVKEILEVGEGLAASALAFCLAYEEISTVIPGNVSEDQLKRNLESLQVKLAPEKIRALEEFYREEVADLKLPW